MKMFEKNIAATFARGPTVSLERLHKPILILAVLTAVGCGPASQAEGIPEYGVEVVHTYPHDSTAFTQGLLYLSGFLYESTGLNGQSSIRKVKLETGEVLQKHDIPEAY